MAPESQIEMGFSLAEFHQEMLSIPTLLTLLNCFGVDKKKKKLFLAIILSLMIFLQHLLHFFLKYQNKTDCKLADECEDQIDLIQENLIHMHRDNTTLVTVTDM